MCNSDILSSSGYFYCQGNNPLNFGLIFKNFVPKRINFPAFLSKANWGRLYGHVEILQVKIGQEM